MKKLLLVLLVVTLASFLLVGCLGEGTVVDDGDGDEVIPPPVQAVTIVTAKEYTNPLTEITYVPGSDTVTVTFPESVPSEYVVIIAQQIETAGVITNVNEVTAAPKAGSDRKIWTKPYDFATAVGDGECEAICLVALEKHPCCAGVQAALKVVTVDYTAPVVTPTITVLDCNPCDVPVACADPGGAYFTYTTLVTGGTDCVPTTTGNCGIGECSGVGAWSFVVDKDCDACPTASGIGCTVVGATDCGCLPYVGEDWEDSEDNVTYTIYFNVKDNVGNAQTEKTWTVVVDSDSVVSSLTPTED